MKEIVKDLCRVLVCWFFILIGVGLARDVWLVMLGAQLVMLAVDVIDWWRAWRHGEPDVADRLPYRMDDDRRPGA